VTASGNTAQNNDSVARYPCSYFAVTMICVAASTQNDTLWSSANYGPNTVHLAAPGVNIYSTLDKSNYGYITGGSMAAPQVSGAAALILSMGTLTADGMKAAILNNVDVLPSLNGLVQTGGRLNICAAIPTCKTAVPGILTNTTVPVVTSIPQQGGLLGASTGFWKGIPTSYTYQWNRCDKNGLNCAPIVGATGQSYAMLASADALATLSVTVTASNSFGSASATSVPSVAVATATSPSSITFSITAGTNISGAVNWTATPARSEQFVQFYIDGAWKQTDSTSPYVFNGTTTSLLDTTTFPNGPHVLGVRALFTDNRTYDFLGETVTVANPPQNTALPTISGTLIPGQTISTSNGVWGANAPPTSFSYQWERCDSNGLNCAIVSGAAGSSYLLSGADTNFTVRSVVTASNLGGSTPAVSAQTGVVPPPPLVITTTSPIQGGIQNTAYNSSVTATGGVPPYTWSITSGSLPVGLSFSSGSGAISGTPTSTGTSNFTVQVADTRSVTTTRALSLTIAVPLSVTTTSLPAGTQLASYSANLAATGGTPPYTWSISSGTLPSGLSLASGTGVISGTSTTAGTSNFTVQVKDANSLTATKPLSIVLNGVISGGSGIGLVQANSVQGTGVGSVSAAFPISNTAGNLILVFVRMSSATQTVTLTDTAGNTYIQAVTQVQSSDNHQSYLFYAKNISSAAGNTVTATFSSTNNHPWMAIYEFQGLSAMNPLDQTASAQGASSAPTSGPTPTTTATNELVFGGAGLASNYSGTLAAGSGFALVENDPSGSPAATEIGLVSSTGSYTATFGLNSSPNWTALIATFAAGGPVAPVVTTTSLPNGTQNTAYSMSVVATGGATPYTWSMPSGSLPAGLSLTSGTGMISGTPTSAGTSNFTVQVTDANSLTGSMALSLTVMVPPSVTTTSLPNGTQNVAYSSTLTATGGTTPYTWSVASGSLPTGLTLASGTGVISGTPTATGTSNFTVQVSDVNSVTATQSLSITVVPPPLTVTTTSLPSGTQNAAYSATLTVTGGTAPYSWSITAGTLPAGLSLASATGVISGTPTGTGTSNFTAQVTDANSAMTTKALSITVGTTPPTVATTSLPNGTQNSAYTTTLTATGGTTPYSWSVTVGTLPTGLTLAAGTGVITGTPTGTGTSNFTVQVTDANSLTGSKSLSLTVIAPLSVTTTSLPNGTQNSAYTTTLTATGGTTPYSWSITSGTLPAGLTLAAGTGVISGTPTGTGTSNFTVQVTDANSLTGTKSLSITINTASGGGIGLVQENAVQGSGVASVSVAFPAANTTGNLILAFVRMSSATQTVTLTDSAGNTYVEAVGQVQTADGSQVHLFYAKGILGAANTVTATFSASNNHPWLAIYEYKGLNAANPLDQTAHAQGNSTAPNSGATATTTSANELVFAAMGLAASYAGTQTTGGGYTLLQNDTSTSPASNESMLVTSTGSFAGAFSITSSVNWSAIVATFKP
jgi:Subtilase family/Putative Ig domain